jgi:hypothetical protein
MSVPMEKSKDWSAKLTRTIVLRDGTKLETLADAAQFILKEPDYIQERASWHRATEQLIEAAETGRGIEEATKRVEDALFLEARYARRWD